MLPEIFGSTARTVLAGIAGALAGKGYIDASMSDTFVGVGLGILTLAWSIWQKKKAQKK